MPGSGCQLRRSTTVIAIAAILSTVPVLGRQWHYTFSSLIRESAWLVPPPAVKHYVKAMLADRAIRGLCYEYHEIFMRSIDDEP